MLWVGNINSGVDSMKPNSISTEVGNAFMGLKMCEELRQRIEVIGFLIDICIYAFCAGADIFLSKMLGIKASW